MDRDSPAGLGYLVDGCFLIRLTQLHFPHVGSCRNSGLTVPQTHVPWLLRLHEMLAGMVPASDSHRTQSVGIFETQLSAVLSGIPKAPRPEYLLTFFLLF